MGESYLQFSSWYWFKLPGKTAGLVVFCYIINNTKIWEISFILRSTIIHTKKIFAPHMTTAHTTHTLSAASQGTFISSLCEVNTSSRRAIVASSNNFFFWMDDHAKISRFMSAASRETKLNHEFPVASQQVSYVVITVSVYFIPCVLILQVYFHLWHFHPLYWWC